MFSLEQSLLVGIFIIISVWFSYRRGQKDMAEYAVCETVTRLIEADHLRVSEDGKGQEELLKIQDIINQEILEFNKSIK